MKKTKKKQKQKLKTDIAEAMYYMELLKHFDIDEIKRIVLITDILPSIAKLIQKIDKLGISFTGFIECDKAVAALGSKTRAGFGDDIINFCKEQQQKRNQTNKSLN